MSKVETVKVDINEYTDIRMKSEEYDKLKKDMESLKEELETERLEKKQKEAEFSEAEKAYKSKIKLLEEEKQTFLETEKAYKNTIKLSEEEKKQKEAEFLKIDKVYKNKIGLLEEEKKQKEEKFLKTDRVYRNKIGLLEEEKKKLLEEKKQKEAEFLETEKAYKNKMGLSEEEFLKAKNEYENEIKLLKEQCSMQKVPPNMMKRIEFLREETIDMITKSIELQQDTLKYAVEQQEGKNEEESLEIWKQDISNRILQEWPTTVKGGILGFVSILYHLYRLLFLTSSNIRLYFERGAVKKSLAKERKAFEEEFYAQMQKMEGERKIFNEECVKRKSELEKKWVEEEQKLKREQEQLQQKFHIQMQKLEEERATFLEKEKGYLQEVEKLNKRVEGLQKWKVVGLIVILCLIFIVIALGAA